MKPSERIKQEADRYLEENILKLPIPTGGIYSYLAIVNYLDEVMPEYKRKESK